MNVELIDRMGTDLSVVNAARVSYAKTKEQFEDKDEKLIAFLAKHNHWSPFAHASLQFRIKAPVFVARQLVKHQVGLSWNEVSRRYVDFPPDSKQGSAGTVDLGHTVNHNLETVTESCLVLYNTLIDKGVAPEQARMVLPQSMMTEWYWSGTLYAFARVCNLRCKPDVQKETRDICEGISKECGKHFPISWKYLIDK